MERLRRLLFILTMLMLGTVTVGAQCLGEDCSIKGRNKANRAKAAKMTGNKKNGKIRKLKRRGTAFDPFSGGGSKRSNSGGFDPFEAESKRKKMAKKGKAFDPFAANTGRRKYKGNKGGFDPFGNNKKSNIKHRRGRANDSWLAGSGNKSVVTGGFAGWDGGKKNKIKNRRGKANDSWISTKRASVSNGGGIWANSNSKRSNGKKKKAGTLNTNWDNVMQTGAPMDNGEAITKSWDDFGGTRISRDITYNKPHQWKFSLLSGSLLKTGSTTKDYLNSVNPGRPVIGAEVAIEWPASGERNFHHYFNLPTAGLALGYMNLGDNDALGHVATLYPYVNIPMIRSEKVDFYFTAGAGIAYVSAYDKTGRNDPDIIENPLNGTPVNGLLQAGLGLNIRPSEHYTIALEGGIRHLTDGAFSQPSKGINIVGGQLALKYNPDEREVVLRGKAETLPKRFTIDIATAGGVKELTHRDDTKYGTANLDIAFNFQAASIYRIGIGVDGWFDNSFSVNHDDANHNKYDGRYDHTDFTDQLRGGVFLNNELVFGRVTTAIAGGIYFYNPIDIDTEKFYFKVGFKYHFARQWFALAQMKTHMWTPDMFQLGLGYSIQL